MIAPLPSDGVPSGGVPSGGVPSEDQPAGVERRADTRAEIEELRTRLREAEEALEAIRSGDVDSLVIGPPDSEQVYTLSTADRPYRMIVAGMGEGAATLSASGAILYTNARLAAMVGRPVGELVGESVLDLAEEADRDILRRLLEVPAGRSARGQLELRGADGVRVPVAVAVSGLDIDPVMFVRCLVATDLTAMRAAELELARSRAARDEAVAAAKLKSQFVAMVSHEIRTPMNGVIGLTNLLLNTPLEAFQRRYAEAIRDSGRALLTIINEMLDFSKIEAGRVDLVDVDFDLAGLLEEVILVAAEASRDKDLEVLCYYPPELPVAVRGDNGRLRQVLLNLLGNAVKFTEHGEVLLRADPGTPTEDGRPRVAFAVADTGIGIARDDLHLLFEPFSQVDAATNRRFGGTGLGLTICRQLIDLMGGRLAVTTEPGQGSRFFFTLPFALQSGRSGTREPRGERLAGRRVLVVDDNPTSRELITAHVGAWGMSATGASDGYAALSHLRRAAAERWPYEVAVIDQRLPDIDGGDLTGRILADDTIPTVKVILLTSGAHRDDAIAAASVAAVLAKPIGPSQLYNCLSRLFERADADLRPPPARGRAPGWRGRILLAEDHEINQIVAVETLAMLGYQTDIARNGVEAVHLAGAGPYDAILMDCQMPEMDGYAATVELRRGERPDRHIPIIAMTAGAYTEDEQRCRAVGMDDYLVKPIDLDQLGAVLDRWIPGRAPGVGR